MDLREYAVTMAHYNRWMNEKLYAACARLDDAGRKRDRGAFFGSVHATLNHLLLADQAWMQRLSGEAVTMRSPRDEVHADFGALAAARAAMDERLLQWAQALPAKGGEFRFFSVSYQRERVLPLHAVVLQVFNHQTHHRGQLTTLLSQAGIDVGVTDIAWMPLFD